MKSHLVVSFLIVILLLAFMLMPASMQAGVTVSTQHAPDSYKANTAAAVERAQTAAVEKTDQPDLPAITADSHGIFLMVGDWNNFAVLALQDPNDGRQINAVNWFYRAPQGSWIIPSEIKHIGDTIFALGADLRIHRFTDKDGDFLADQGSHLSFFTGTGGDSLLVNSPNSLLIGGFQPQVLPGTIKTTKKNGSQFLSPTIESMPKVGTNQISMVRDSHGTVYSIDVNLGVINRTPTKNGVLDWQSTSVFTNTVPRAVALAIGPDDALYAITGVLDYIDEDGVRHYEPTRLVVMEDKGNTGQVTTQIDLFADGALRADFSPACGLAVIADSHNTQVALVYAIYKDPNYSGDNITKFWVQDHEVINSMQLVPQGMLPNTYFGGLDIVQR